MARTWEWTTPEERTAEFNRRYQLLTDPVLLRAEAHAVGGNYGASSYTTSAEARLMSQALDLDPSKVLLELGAGSGWPGLYMAGISGCTVVQTDMAVEGLKVAKSRISSDELGGHVVATGAERLPFSSHVFDAVTSSDVFC